MRMFVTRAVLCQVLHRSLWISGHTVSQHAMTHKLFPLGSFCVVQRPRTVNLKVGTRISDKSNRNPEQSLPFFFYGGTMYT